MGFPINPPNAPLVDPQTGLVTNEWYRFFLNIQKLIGTAASNPFEDVISLASDVTNAGTLKPGTGLSGGGNMGANVDLSLDTANNRNVDHSAVSITAGTGLSGGGTIAASRTINLANTAVTPGTYSPPAHITVDQQGRITAIS